MSGACAWWPWIEETTVIQRIPVSEPDLKTRELALVAECLSSGWISSSGPFIERFEEAWAGYCGRKYGIAVSSGTAALQIAAQSLDLEKDDEVIMPSFTIISCPLAVLYAGGVPVLVDCDPDTWCLDVDEVRKRITPRTRAIMAVHLYGHPADMDALQNLADEHGLAILEDAAEAHGAECLVRRRDSSPSWRRCGSFGIASCFSFYANKLITTGEGGMVLTDDARLAERARSLRNLCFQRDRRFYHERLGFNFRLTSLQAALGVGQVERMDAIVERKRQVAAEYRRRLGAVERIQLQTEREWARSVFWMNGIVLSTDREMDGVGLAAALAFKGVDTRPFFLGMHEQPAFHAAGLFRGEHYPVTERLARQGLYLPSGLALTDAQLADVCDAVLDAVR